mmetsp:Transcript_11191/g.9570  ORF Transcript_11191/g.9570 Transcript_11191/m.9570 type:complete len:100 (+) Transcript_11191:843-1142(+)
MGFEDPIKLKNRYYSHIRKKGLYDKLLKEASSQGYSFDVKKDFKNTEDIMKAKELALALNSDGECDSNSISPRMSGSNFSNSPTNFAEKMDSIENSHHQ